MDRFTWAERRERDESFRVSAGPVVLAAFLIAVVWVVIALFPEYLLGIISAFTAVIGAGKLIDRQLRARENDELPPASAAFRALADPNRPLTASDPISAMPSHPALPAEAESRAES